MTSSRKAVPDSYRVLLVDDNHHGNAARKRVLEDQGFVVEVALSGEEAWELFSRTPFDLVVTDLKMKRMTGTELIALIRASGKPTRTILLSGFAGCLGLTEEVTGADAVLCKSSNEHEMLPRTARMVLARKAPRKPPISQGKTRATVA